MGDFFAGSMNSYRRSRTTDSRNSTLTGSTAGSSIGRFSRTSSTTAATSIDDEPQSASMSKGSRNSRTRSLSRGAKKLVKRAKSPFTSDRERTPDSDDDESPGPSVMHTRAHSQPNAYRKDSYGRKRPASRNEITVDASERDLAMRLELARRNSQNQNGHEYDSAIEEPLEETIYEGMQSSRSY